MSHPLGLSEWTACVSSHLSHLSKPQATVLAMWSFGIAITRSCGRLTVATFLALLLDRKTASVEQRLYEWCIESEHKAGTHRRALDVTSCFVPLLRWIVQIWSSNQLALTLDATTLSDRFVVLVVSVVYRGIGIPVAWTVLPAAQKRAWRREWLRLLRLLRPALPRDWTVLVLADRGLFAGWLFRRIVRLGWHPFVRINGATKFRPDGQAQWVWIRSLCPTLGSTYQGHGTAVKARTGQLNCTLLGWWGEGYSDPWFVLTDLDATACSVEWYRLRAWCEQGFKCTKRGGWQWQQTQMSNPERAGRLWLALAVAMLWMVSLGSDLEDGPALPELPDLGGLLSGVVAGKGRRHLRLFRVGWLRLLVRLISHQSLPLPSRLLPEPWPSISHHQDQKRL